MPAVNISQAFLFGTLLIGGVFGCTTIISGATWEYQYGVDEEIHGINTAEKCSDLCRDDVMCRGYTWITNGVAGYCYKFRNLNGIHSCEGCSSGTIPESLAGACAGSIDDVLAEDTADNFEECNQFCYSTEGCNAFTYFNQSSPFSNSCFLYSVCDDQVPCYGCTSGRINCIPSPQCYQHFLLNEESRRQEFYNTDNYIEFCDFGEGYIHKSPMWQGSGFYRFVEPAGTMMPEAAPGERHCGTGRSGWLNGKHPTEMGQVIEVEACFDFGGNKCDVKRNVTVTRCEGFYVYYLVDVQSCNSRYCGS